MRRVLRLFRGILPDTRRRQLRSEVNFWRNYIGSRGLEWPEDYAQRLEPATPIQEPLSSWVSRSQAEEVQILDVGSGPLTKLGKVHPSKRIVLTPVDVLAREYAELVEQFGLRPPVPTVFGDAQSLQDQFGAAAFDIVHAENSLDHTADPVGALHEMMAVLRSGGVAILIHAQNEGQNQRYEDLHKWDFGCEDGDFIIAGPGPGGARRNVTQMFAKEATVNCKIRDDGRIVVEMKKLAAS